MISIAIIFLIVSLLNRCGVSMSIWVPHLLLDFIGVFAMEMHVYLTILCLAIRRLVMVVVILTIVLSGLASVSRTVFSSRVVVQLLG